MTAVAHGVGQPLDRIPRVALVAEPTPLQEASRLSAELGVRVLFKRDDLTGAGLGGNKLRGLEYLVADARREGCDCLVTGAGPQSNWTLLAALACLRYGLEAHVVCYGTGAADEGNMRLHRWLGTDVRFTGSGERASVDAGIAAVGDELRAAGRRPYLVPRGGATPLGSLGYVRASAELATQLAELGESPTRLWLATGSCGTQAGLVAGAALAGTELTGAEPGARLSGAGYRVTGVSVSRPVAECRERVATLAAQAGALASARAGALADSGSAAPADGGGALAGGGGGVRMPPVEVLAGWIGAGYGVASEAGEAAARLVARLEGVFLDPVFGAKAMAALINACRSREVTGTQLFLVSGGAPTLFTSKAEL
ncbi:MAG TPA: pyridoxal-phosphate dependent enzyme [Streptosporangiaceae bacterium]|jgi:D-cysteine desulfhydrase